VRKSIPVDFVIEVPEGLTQEDVLQAIEKHREWQRETEAKEDQKLLFT